MTESTIEHQHLGTLWELYSQFRDSGDDRGARRLFKLLEKSYRNWHAACFCGHFSAGKSTLLNTLLSEDLLPTSPVPTSGNLVRLEPGPELVRVMYKNGETAVMNPPYNAEKLKEWCKNTQEIDEVRIQMGDTFPPNWMLFDTPGVDATDRDHQAATEDAVFLADSILFVADYNHIQSEANFDFLDRVQRLGKPIYLIVNQIDKHQENEITFDEYSSRIEKSLKDWGLRIERIFYLSLADLNHPNNEWEIFKAFISELAKKQPDTNSLNTILEALVSDHKQWWKETYGAETEPTENLGDLQKQVADLASKQKALKSDLELNSVETWIEKAKTSIERTIESAVLTPYETRELAKSYLEAIQPDFKMGFFSTKAKIEKERETRLNLLLEDLNERVKTLNWQTGDTFYKTVEPLVSHKDALKRVSQSLELIVDMPLIHSQINAGAQLTGAYLLNFADQLAKAIQKEMRLLINEKFEDLKEELKAGLMEKLSAESSELAEVQTKLNNLEHMLDIQNQEHHHFNDLDALLTTEVQANADIKQSVKELLAAPPKMVASKKEVHLENDSKNDLPERKPEGLPLKAENISSLDEELDAEKLIEAASVLVNARGFEDTASELKNRLERLQNQSLTVALFGAFSAGKSSFANAMLGESVLKVSPNPTTAVVNRILPVDDAHPHGHMILFMKSEEALLQDLHRALTPFGKKIEHLDQLSRTIRSLPKLGAGYSKGKLYLAFLEAVEIGLKELRPYLGKERVVELSVGQEIVANETQACIIDRVDLYYDCEATRKGLILVDTPGADSLNARHTETSYKYIKSADAVVFVTYYQHAFSRADETFLRQLGRIQDAFERDKFFFIVNAIDLARNEDERQQVMTFVTQQLKNLGLNSPRLFGLSSLLALKSKQKADEELYAKSGFLEFQSDWDRFVNHDLVGQTLRSAKDELGNALDLLNDFIEKGNMTDEERKTVLEDLEIEAKQAKEVAQTAASDWMSEELHKTVDELYYYVNQRLSLQLSENFSRFFNPSVLRQDQGSKTEALSACLEECLSYLSNELEQEVRATGIRVEAGLSRMLHEFHTQISQKLGRSWTVRKHDQAEWSTAPLPYDFIDVPRENLVKTFKLYKNPKQFFEENGIKQFKEALLSLLAPLLDDYIEKAQQLTNETYQNQLEVAVKKEREQNELDLTHLFDQKNQSIRESKLLQDSYIEVKTQMESLIQKN